MYCKIVSRVEGDVNEGQLYKLVGRQAYPTVLLLDFDGEVLGKLGSTRTVEALRGMARRGDGFAAFKKKAEGGDRNALIELTIARLEMKSTTVEKAAKLLGERGDFTPDQEKRWAQAELSNRINLWTSSKDAGERAEAARKLYGLYAEGRRPVTDSDALRFWTYVMAHAESIRDVEGYETGIEEVRKRYGKRTGYWKKWFAKHESKLKKLRQKEK
jgi:hypothetical protein